MIIFVKLINYDKKKDLMTPNYFSHLITLMNFDASFQMGYKKSTLHDQILFYYSSLLTYLSMLADTKILQS